jgi:hypothetical protein
MTIEVKQLLVKSTVTQGDRATKEEVIDPADLEEWKEELMRECRRMIESRLREAKER